MLIFSQFNGLMPFGWCEILIFAFKNLGMNHLISATLLFLGLLFGQAQAQNLPFAKTFQFQTKSFNTQAIYAHAYEPLSKRVFVLNRGANQMNILDLSDLNKVRFVRQISLTQVGARPNDVAVIGNIVAVISENNLKQANGRVAFFDTTGTFLNQLTVGPEPTALKFANGGTHLIITNQGSPSQDYFTDPPGSISVVAIFGTNPLQLNSTNVFSINFERLDTVAYDNRLRIFNNANQLPSIDIEPLQIGPVENTNLAAITLGTNNGLALIDYFNGTLDTVYGLGLKDNGLPNQGFDGSVVGNITIQPYSKIYSLYNPVGMASLLHNGASYFLTANQGLPRRYMAYDEVDSLKNIPLNPGAFPNRNTLVRDSVLGWLEVSKELGKAQNGFIHDSAVAFGGRSFSVWNDSAQLIWDSGDDFEQTIAALNAANFNASAVSNTSRKSQSVKQGPQPNSIAIGTVNGNRYAFITLKQMGGFFIYNLNDPTNPVFEQYISDRNFLVPANDTAAGDLGPEKITFVPAGDSPTGIALLLLSNSVSGSFSVYQVGQGIGLPSFENSGITQVWPNPSNGVYHTNQPQKFKVYNQSGSLIKEFKKHEEIDISEAPAGFYLITTASGRALKVIKK
jgi:hypothetical protein